MSEQIPAPVEAATEDDGHGRAQQRFFDVGFWTVTGGIALAVTVSFLVDPAGAWSFWVRMSEFISLPL